jgi:soluble cytochrome b562
MAHRNPYIRALIPGLVLLGLFVNSANGFFPTIQREQIAGNGGVSHEAITLDLYNQLVVEFFPDIKVTTTRMTRARKTWVDANIAVDDDDATLSASHFDGENFVGGQERLIRLLDEVKSNLESSSNEAAQTALGQALHTLQDFYSHTTWVELGR